MLFKPIHKSHLTTSPVNNKVLSRLKPYQVNVKVSSHDIKSSTNTWEQVFFLNPWLTTMKIKINKKIEIMLHSSN